MRAWDAFCGVGGASCGFNAVNEVTVVGGIDWDDKMLRMWATNTRARAICASIGQDEIEWPAAAEDLFIHLSPPCTALSKARAGSATKEEVAQGVNMLKFTLDLIIDKGYVNFSLENVSTVNSRATAHSGQIQ
mgnify:CR=1 FL=1